MIRVLYLLWIVPMAASFGFCWAAILGADKEGDR